MAGNSWILCGVGLLSSLGPLPFARQWELLAVSFPNDIQEDPDNMENLKRGEIRDFTMEKRCVRRDGSIV